MTTYTFDFALPGLNGKNGLIRSHWSAKKKMKQKTKKCKAKNEFVGKKVTIGSDSSRDFKTVKEWMDRHDKNLADHCWAKGDGDAE